MHKYLLWVRLNQYQTANTYVMARDDIEARQIGEAMFGIGNVLHITRED